MVTYSTNWMGPITTRWYTDRGLTRRVVEEDHKGVVFEYDEITVYYSCGRIDIRDDEKEGYDGWDEYGLAPMHGEDWNALSYWLDNMQTEEIWSYEKLIEHFQYWYKKEIRWWKDMRNRHGVEYSYVECDDKLYRFNMAEEHMKYMRIGGKDGVEGIDFRDLGMFDPPGGPYVAVGSKIYWDEIHEGTEQEPLIVKRIMDHGVEGLFVEVE